MRYQAIQRARFLARPNRFIAHVDLNGRTEVCHVKNTGRCRELLVPGCTVYLEGSANPARKTKYDLVAVEKGERGMTVTDLRPLQGHTPEADIDLTSKKRWDDAPEDSPFRGKAPNTHVGIRLDFEKFRKLLLDTLRTYE